MADKRQAELYQTQISLTEWLEKINHKDAEAIRAEDNDKRERLAALKDVIGLPYDQQVKFEAADLRDKTAAWRRYVSEHGDELCALRLIPKKPGLPKLRLRGETVAGVYDWFLKQDIKAEDYRAEYVPHAKASEWSTIFAVNKHGIQGEIIRGGHYQLTQGFFDSGEPIIFHFDFKKWRMSRTDDKAKKHLKTIAAHLRVPDLEHQRRIKKVLGGEFAAGYLKGYFETVSSREFGLWFVDYSQSLGKMYEDFTLHGVPRTKGLVKGMVGSPGKASGKVYIVKSDKLNAEFPAGGVLVCAVTTPDYVPLMRKAAAIITDQGGILSHAAIVARELKVPCIVGTGSATKVLTSGQTVSVDTDLGLVTPV